MICYSEEGQPFASVGFLYQIFPEMGLESGEILSVNTEEKDGGASA